MKVSKNGEEGGCREAAGSQTYWSHREKRAESPGVPIKKTGFTGGSFAR